SSDPVGFGTKIIPSLAKSWKRLDDLTMEVVLRDDILFHDGTPVTADDVKYTIDRIIDPKADPKLQVVIVAFQTYDHVDVIDTHTLHIVTKAPDIALEQRFALLYIVSRAAAEAQGLAGYALKPIGAGPYKVTEFVANDHLTFESFDQYYGGLPPFSKITVRAIPEVATRIAGILSNEVQLISDVTPDQIPSLQSDDSIQVNSIASANAHFFFYNTKMPVLADKRIRQGLNMAIDRQLIIDTLWMGNADMMSSYQVPDWGDMYNPDRPTPKYDPDQAKQLIQAAGYDGTEIKFRVPTTYYTLGADAAQAIVSMWQDVGVKASVELNDDPHGDKPHLMVCFWSAALTPADPTVTFSNIWAEKGEPQTYFWTPADPKFNQNLDFLTTSLDAKARYTAYQQILDIWDDEAPASMLYRVHSIYGQKKTVGWTPNTTFEMDLRASNIGKGDASDATPGASPEASPAS
ncbi:MAG TPA: ABC transporter substrate-binding protein, partial [Thermomicrobiales bacterium]|nr:ABC transporter substrate-binding protein [Thermomicrobiales bacterium]